MGLTKATTGFSNSYPVYNYTTLFAHNIGWRFVWQQRIGLVSCIILGSLL